MRTRSLAGRVTGKINQLGKKLKGCLQFPSVSGAGL